MIIYAVNSIDEVAKFFDIFTTAEGSENSKRSNDYALITIPNFKAPIVLINQNVAQSYPVFDANMMTLTTDNSGSPTTICLLVNSSADLKSTVSRISESDHSFNYINDTLIYVKGPENIQVILMVENSADMESDRTLSATELLVRSFISGFKKSAVDRPLQQKENNLDDIQGELIPTLFLSVLNSTSITSTSNIVNNTTSSTTITASNAVFYRQLVANSIRAVRFRTEIFDGEVLFMINTSGYSSITSSSNSNGSSSNNRGRSSSGDASGNSVYKSRFEGSTATFDLQVQGKFLRIPEGRLFCGAEITKRMDLGLLTRGMCGTMLQLGRRMNAYLHHSFGDKDDFELPHIVSPLWSTVDKLVITPPSQSPPPLGISFPETPEQRAARKRVYDYEVTVALENVYSFSVSTEFLDLINWRVVNIPLLSALSLHTFWRDADLRLCAYCVPSDPTVLSKTQPSTTTRLPTYHPQSVNQYCFGIDIKHSTNHPELLLTTLPSQADNTSLAYNATATNNKAAAVKKRSSSKLIADELDDTDEVAVDMKSIKKILKNRAAEVAEDSSDGNVATALVNNSNSKRRGSVKGTKRRGTGMDVNGSSNLINSRGGGDITDMRKSMAAAFMSYQHEEDDSNSADAANVSSTSMNESGVINVSIQIPVKSRRASRMEDEDEEIGDGDNDNEGDNESDNDDLFFDAIEYKDNGYDYEGERYEGDDKIRTAVVNITSSQQPTTPHTLQTPLSSSQQGRTVNITSSPSSSSSFWYPPIIHTKSSSSSSSSYFGPVLWRDRDARTDYCVAVIEVDDVRRSRSSNSSGSSSVQALLSLGHPPRRYVYAFRLKVPDSSFASERISASRYLDFNNTIYVPEAVSMLPLVTHNIQSPTQHQSSTTAKDGSDDGDNNSESGLMNKVILRTFNEWKEEGLDLFAYTQNSSNSSSSSSNSASTTSTTSLPAHLARKAEVEQRRVALQRAFRIACHKAQAGDTEVKAKLQHFLCNNKHTVPFLDPVLSEGTLAKRYRQYSPSTGTAAVGSGGQSKSNKDVTTPGKIMTAAGMKDSNNSNNCTATTKQALVVVQLGPNYWSEELMTVNMNATADKDSNTVNNNNSNNNSNPCVSFLTPTQLTGRIKCFNLPLVSLIDVQKIPSSQLPFYITGLKGLLISTFSRQFNITIRCSGEELNEWVRLLRSQISNVNVANNKTATNNNNNPSRLTSLRVSLSVAENKSAAQQSQSSSSVNKVSPVPSPRSSKSALLSRSVSEKIISGISNALTNTGGSGSSIVSSRRPSPPRQSPQQQQSLQQQLLETGPAAVLANESSTSILSSSTPSASSSSMQHMDLLVRPRGWRLGNDRVVLNNRMFITADTCMDESMQRLQSTLIPFVMQYPQQPNRLVEQVLKMAFQLIQMTTNATTTSGNDTQVNDSSSNSNSNQNIATTNTNNQLWLDFMNGTCLLQRLDLTVVSSTSSSSSSSTSVLQQQVITDDELITFYLNLYHCLLLHAFLVVGSPSSVFKWPGFFSTLSYEVSNDIFSLAELEHCIIKEGKPLPYVNILSQSFLPHATYDFPTVVNSCLFTSTSTTLPSSSVAGNAVESNNSNQQDNTTPSSPSSSQLQPQQLQQRDLSICLLFALNPGTDSYSSSIPIYKPSSSWSSLTSSSASSPTTSTINTTNIAAAATGVAFQLEENLRRTLVERQLVSVSSSGSDNVIYLPQLCLWHYKWFETLPLPLPLPIISTTTNINNQNSTASAKSNNSSSTLNSNINKNMSTSALKALFLTLPKEKTKGFIILFHLLPYCNETVIQQVHKLLNITAADTTRIDGVFMPNINLNVIIKYIPFSYSCHYLQPWPNNISRCSDDDNR